MGSATRIRVMLAIFLIPEMILFFSVPLTVIRQRRDHLGSDYATVEQQDSESMYNLRSFRDVPWELGSKGHDAFESTFMLYYPLAAMVFGTNFVLWYLWFGFRLFVDFKASLLVHAYCFSIAELCLNMVSQFPPPFHYVQLEPEAVSYFLGLVVPPGYGMMSSRASLSFVLCYDMLHSIWPDRHVTRKALTVIYSLMICLFLLFTRQMYSVALLINLLASFAIYHFGKELSTSWEQSLQQRTGVRQELKYSVEGDDEEEELSVEELGRVLEPSGTQRIMMAIKKADDPSMDRFATP